MSTPTNPADPPAPAPAPAPAPTPVEPVTVRLARLEEGFGDPDDPENPLGFRAVLAAEEEGRLLPAAEALLREHGLGAELVPAALGGRLAQADELARVVRPVFRRDMGLGIGAGIASLFAGSAVWTAGDARQQGMLAERLLRGGRAAVVHHSMAHGNALLTGELSALQNSTGFRLSGRKDVVINATDAQALVVYARTDPAPGSRSHSVLLLAPDELPPGTLTRLPRRPTPGLRGCGFYGLEFTNCKVPAEALVGGTGQGIRLALRTFQFHRPLSTAAAIAAVDPVLRAAVGTGSGGPGVSARVRLRRHRPLLAGVFADLLACDSLTSVVLRALHLCPDSAHLAAAEVKYLVPDLLREDLEELSTVIGAGAYRGDRGHGQLTKLLRDLPTAGLGHAGTAACQSVVVPQLPLLARRSWFRAQPPPAALCRLDAPLAPLDLSALSVAGGDDAPGAVLVDVAARLEQGPRPEGPREETEALLRLVPLFVAELRMLRDRCVEIELGDLAALSSPELLALADRHAIVSAAGAALGVWWQQRGDGFLGEVSWLVLALHRLGRRLGSSGLPALPESCAETVLTEAERRFREGRSFDLYADRVAGAPAEIRRG